MPVDGPHFCCSLALPLLLFDAFKQDWGLAYSEYGVAFAIVLVLCERGYALFKQIELLWEKKYMLKLLVRQDNFNLVLPFKLILHQKYWKNKQKSIKTASFAISFTYVFGVFDVF